MSKRVEIKHRKCPRCHSRLTWVGEKRSATDAVLCRKGAACGWTGPFFNSMPIAQEDISNEPQYEDLILSALDDSFNFQLDGTKALDSFEQHLINNEHGDPDTKGQSVIRMYIRRMSQLRLLCRLIDMSGLTPYKDHIIKNEILYLFPTAPTTTIKK